MPGPKDLDPSTSPRALLGAELRHARIKAGLTQDDLGDPLFVSGSYIGQMEAGTRRILREHAVRLDEVLGTTDFFTRNCEVSSRSRYPDHFAEAAEAETMATTIMESSTLLIPGLLQTEAYARAVFRAYQPLATEEALNSALEARLARAQLLSNPTSPLLWAVLDEAVLRRQVGGPGVMAEALEHVASLVQRHRIIVQVIPFTAGAHAAMTSDLKLMTFSDAPPLAFLDSPYSGKLLDDPVSVARHQLTYDLIRAGALSPKESLALILSTAEEYAHEAQQP
ncbi:helix-turn-helix domain-containing protein [Streptomyces zhihengii]